MSQLTQSGRIALRIGCVAEACLNIQAGDIMHKLLGAKMNVIILLKSKISNIIYKLDLSAPHLFKRKKRHMYQNVLPQFFLVRSISFGENVISFLMLITGRVLGGQNSVSNSTRKWSEIYSKTHMPDLSPVDKHRVREGADSQVRVGVLV